MKLFLILAKLFPVGKEEETTIKLVVTRCIANPDRLKIIFGVQKMRYG